MTAAPDMPAGPKTDPTTPTIGVFIVDDHELVRRGLVSLLGTTPDLRVVGEAATAEEARRMIPQVAPDVALLDGRLPDGSGIDVCRDVRSAMPGLHCLILTSYDDDEALFAAVMAGASGYLLKQIGGASLTDAIRTAATGRSLIDPVISGKLLSRLRRPTPDNRAEQLTEREREILDLVAEGLTNRQIGARMYLAEKTIKNYVSGLLSKLGMQRRTQIAVFGAQLRQHDDSPS
ncbi:response regulator [Microlunatus soli]|uniref:DNA-binding response regulator, NarL/FixJ family, contains REC and HTH domains n=1 Tax=Microlunatus soli TaxID=630515 RepID=A0A1H1PR27_9ACTN|nr:response regulator transcription factor [Microlunatus soli]SDS13487.1 DNA-binding response regulator, NarL/FixJ family, contains REC and HTH domains [Microlunatus soli]